MLLGKYLKSSTLIVVGRVVQAFTGFFDLWLLGSLLGEKLFGLFMLGTAFCLLFGNCAVIGIEKLVILRVTQAKRFSEIESIGHSSVRLAFYCGALIALALTLLSFPFAAFYGDVSLRLVIQLLCWSIPLFCYRQVVAAWLQGQQRIGESTFCTLIAPCILKTVLLSLLLVFPLEPGKSSIVLACGLILLSNFIASLIIAVRFHPPKSDASFRFSKQDLGYAWKTSVNRVLHEPTRTIGTLVVGALAPSQVAGGYAICSKIAELLRQPKAVFDSLLVPRMGKHVARKDLTLLENEYGLIRNCSSCLVLCGAACVFVCGQFLLRIFGDYQDLFPALVGLACAVVIQVSFGSSGQLLAMLGDASTILRSTLISAMCFSLAVSCFHHEWGYLSVVFATAASALVKNVYEAIVLQSRYKLDILDFPSIATMTCSVLGTVVSLYRSEWFVMSAAILSPAILLNARSAVGIYVAKKTSFNASFRQRA